MKLKINKRKKFKTFRNMWKLNNTFLNNKWIKEEIKREVRKYFKMKENKNTTSQAYETQLKQHREENQRC